MHRGVNDRHRGLRLDNHALLNNLYGVAMKTPGLSHIELIISSEALRSFEERFHGTLILPGDAEYDDARHVWNGMIDRYPAVIARCADAADVATAIDFARRYDLPLAVRGGGHNVAGFATCDDGLVIDLSTLRDIEVDSEARTVRTGAGCRWGDVDAATQRYGLAAPGGVVSDTGIAGLTLGGGFGYLSRKYGLSVDNVLAVKIVTADGVLRTASETENPDLFWALRGGGGNFGVVTEFTYRLHPIGPDVYFSMVLHDGRGARMKKAFRTFRDFAESAPDEISLLAGAGIVPPGAEHFPEAIHGMPFLMTLGMYAGDPEAGRRTLEPLENFSEPLANLSEILPYAQAQKALDEDYPARTMRYYWKSARLPHLTDEVIDVVVEHARRQPSPYSTIDVWHVGGAVTRVPEDRMAYSGRTPGYLFNPEANWLDATADEANVRWVNEALDAVRPHADGGRYLNFPGMHEEGERVMRATFGEKYARLVEIKKKYDPENVFRLNQNILPDSGKKNGYHRP